MSKEKEERELKFEEIQKRLEIIMEDTALTKVEQLFAKLLFNLRYDLQELKLELLKAFKPEDITEEPCFDKGGMFS